MENQIDFVKAGLIKKMKKETKAESESSEEGDFYVSEMDKAKRSLLVYQLREELLECIRDNQVTILVGETGSGKTT